LTVLEVAFDLRFEQIGDCLPAGWLRARVDPFQKEEAAHVVDDIGHLPLRLRELQRLARMTILVRQLCGFVLPLLWDPSFPKIGFLSVRIALL